MKKEQATFFVVTFRDPKDSKVTTLKAKSIYDSPLGLGFICISGFIFETNSLVVNPEAEDQAKKFKDTKSLHLSLYSILTIEEIGQTHEGLTLQKDRSNLHILPSPDATH